MSDNRMARVIPTMLINRGSNYNKNKTSLQQENKRRQKENQIEQDKCMYWSNLLRDLDSTTGTTPSRYLVDSMCPRGLALHHPTAGHLLSYATGSCSTNTGHPWKKQQMEEAITRGLHISTMDSAAMAQLTTELK